MNVPIPTPTPTDTDINNTNTNTNNNIHSAHYQQQHQQQHPAMPLQHQTPTPPSSTDLGPTIVQNAHGQLQQVAGYVIRETLGSGSFAIVFKGVKHKHKFKSLSNNNNGNHIHNHNASENENENQTETQTETDTVAIKAINRKSEKITKKVLQSLELEISILQQYQHANIVCLREVHKTDNHIFLILEYCAGGDLRRLIRSRKSGRLTERLARRLMKDLTAGLFFLARQQLIHRDIKPENLLLTGSLPWEEREDNPPTDKYSLEEEEEEEKKRAAITCSTTNMNTNTNMNMNMNTNMNMNSFHLKIADFGFARHLQKTSLADTLCGSPLYMAPEILQHKR